MNSRPMFLLQKCNVRNLGSQPVSLEQIFYWETSFIWYYFGYMKQWGTFHCNIRGTTFCSELRRSSNSLTYICILRVLEVLHSGEGPPCGDPQSFLRIFGLHCILKETTKWQHVRLDIIMAVRIWIMVVGEVMLCNLIKIHQYYGSNYLPYYTVSHARRL